MNDRDRDGKVLTLTEKGRSKTNECLYCVRQFCTHIGAETLKEAFLLDGTSTPVSGSNTISCGPSASEKVLVTFIFCAARCWRFDFARTEIQELWVLPQSCSFFWRYSAERHRHRRAQAYEHHVTITLRPESHCRSVRMPTAEL